MAGRTVKIQILGDAKSAQGAFGSVGQAADGFASRIGGVAKLAGVAMVGIGAAVGAAAVVGIKAASDYTESWNKVGEVFDDQAGRIQEWSKSAAQSFGLSRSEALATAGDFGNLFTAMGIGTKPAADMSEGIVQLAADLGSFNNMGTEEVLEKIRAGLVGETEPLRSLGVNLDAATIAQKALNMGLTDTKGELTPAMKAQAAYALILEQTTTAQGDFQRTKSGMANSLKVIKASFADLQVEIGQRLLPVIAPLIAALAANMPRALDMAGRMLDWLAGKLRGPLSQAFVLIRDGVLTFIQALQGNWADNENIRGFHRVIGNIALIIREQVIPAVQGMVAFFTGTLIPAVQGVVGFVGQLRDAFGEGGFAGALALLAAKLGPVAEQLLTWAGTVLVQLVGKLGEWAGAFLDWIGPMIPPLLVELGKIYLALQEWMLGTALPAIIEQLAAWGQALVDWIGPRIGPMLEALGSLLGSLGSWLIDTALPAIAEKLAEWGVAFVEWVGPQIPPLLEKLGGLLSDLGGWLIDTALPEIVSKLAEWGKAFLDWIATDVLPQLPGKLGEILSAVTGFVLEKAADLGTALLGWATKFLVWVTNDVIPSLPGKLGEILSSITGWVTDTLADLASEGARIGGEILSGIGSAIRNGAESIVGSAIDFVTSLIPEWARKGLGIESPSKVMHDQVGIPIVEGIATGITDSAGLLQSSMLRLANDALNAGHSAMRLTGQEIAKALLEGWTAEGSNKEIYPFEHLFNADVAQALIDMKQTAEKNLVLGQIAGKDTTELQAALDDILALIAQFEDEVDTTIVEFMDGANIGAAVAEQWQSLLGDLDGILDGSVQARLGDTLAGLQRQMQFAITGGAPADVIAGIQANIDAARQQLAVAQQAMATAGEAGLIESAFQIPLDRLPALMAQMQDGGLGMVDKLVDGVASGATDVEGVMGVLQGIIAAGSDKLPETIGASVHEVIGVLGDLEKRLTVDLAQAFIDGTDPTVIEENLAVIAELLGDLQAQADVTARSIRGVNAVSGQIIKPPPGMGSGGSVSRRSSSSGIGQSSGVSGGGLSGRVINLTMPSGQLVGQWYADAVAEDALAPVAIGGLV